MLKNKKKYYLFSAFIFLGFLASGIAQPYHNVDKLTGVVRLYDTVLKFPAPSWIAKNSNDAKLLSQAKTSRQQTKHSFMLEMIPSAESFDKWKQLFGINAFYIGEKTVPLAYLINNSIHTFRSACGQKYLRVISTIKKRGAFETLFIFCENSPHAPAQSGYANGIGEIGLFHFMRSKHVLVKVYSEWRGKQFAFKNQATWPVKKSTLIEMKRRFNYIKLTQLNTKQS